MVKRKLAHLAASNAESLEGSSPSSGTKPPYEGPCTILGGLPVWAKLHASYDPYWNEADIDVVSIHWVDRYGNPRGEISQKVYDKAQDYDYGFCDLITQVDEYVSHLQWMAEAPERERKKRAAKAALVRRVQQTTRKRKRALAM